MEYKPNSFVDYEFKKKKKNLVRLFRIIATNLRCNQEALPWAEKIYGMVKQIFVSKICKTGHGANLAFKYIHQIKLYIHSSEVEIDEIVDLEL